jgi:hypothetical protein
MEGSASSKAEEKEPTSSISVRTAERWEHRPLGIVFPHVGKRKKKKENFWILVITWTNGNLIREPLVASWS